MEKTKMEPQETRSREGTDRRAFLATAGKFAVVVPPAMTMLLSTTMNSPAIAASAAAPQTSAAPAPAAPAAPTAPTISAPTIRTRGS
jgi:hypothetical protein